MLRRPSSAVRRPPSAVRPLSVRLLSTPVQCLQYALFHIFANVSVSIHYAFKGNFPFCIFLLKFRFLYAFKGNFPFCFFLLKFRFLFALKGNFRLCTFLLTFRFLYMLSKGISLFAKRNFPLGLSLSILNHELLI